jgi:hypothetical protein
MAEEFEVGNVVKLRGEATNRNGKNLTVTNVDDTNITVSYTNNHGNIKDKILPKESVTKGKVFVRYPDNETNDELFLKHFNKKTS